MNRIEIRKWLLENSLTIHTLAVEAGVKQPHLSNVIAERRKSRRLAIFLLKRGVPREFLNEDWLNEEEPQP